MLPFVLFYLSSPPSLRVFLNLNKQDEAGEMMETLQQWQAEQLEQHQEDLRVVQQQHADKEMQQQLEHQKILGQKEVEWQRDSDHQQQLLHQQGQLSKQEMLLQ